MNRREFMKLGALGAIGTSAGCASNPDRCQRSDAAPAASVRRPTFHVFSKMFQAPICANYDAVAELMAAAGFDGIEWTVRPKGHVEPSRVKTDLPKAVAAARKQGLTTTMMVTAITHEKDPDAETVLRTAADCGLVQYRPGYYFYDAKKETFRQSFDRIKAGFASLEKLGEKTGLKACYQNHSSWGPSIFGGVVWDLYEAIRPCDPRYVGIEYDPMHARFETNLSWSHGMDLVSDRIGAVCLKDFSYRMSPKNPKDHAKNMCGAGDGIINWKEVRAILQRNKVHVPYIVHFEYDFSKTDLLKSVKTELDRFKRFLA